MITPLSLNQLRNAATILSRYTEEKKTHPLRSLAKFFWGNKELIEAQLTVERSSMLLASLSKGSDKERTIARSVFNSVDAWNASTPSHQSIKLFPTLSNPVLQPSSPKISQLYSISKVEKDLFLTKALGTALQYPFLSKPTLFEKVREATITPIFKNNSVHYRMQIPLPMGEKLGFEALFSQEQQPILKKYKWLYKPKNVFLSTGFGLNPLFLNISTLRNKQMDCRNIYLNLRSFHNEFADKKNDILDIQYQIIEHLLKDRSTMPLVDDYFNYLIKSAHPFENIYKLFYKIHQSAALKPFSKIQQCVTLNHTNINETLSQLQKHYFKKNLITLLPEEGKIFHALFTLFSDPCKIHMHNQLANSFNLPKKALPPLAKKLGEIAEFQYRMIQHEKRSLCSELKAIFTYLKPKLCLKPSS